MPIGSQESFDLQLQSIVTDQTCHSAQLLLCILRQHENQHVTLSKWFTSSQALLLPHTVSALFVCIFEPRVVM